MVFAGHTVAQPEGEDLYAVGVEETTQDTVVDTAPQMDLAVACLVSRVEDRVSLRSVAHHLVCSIFVADRIVVHHTVVRPAQSPSVLDARIELLIVPSMSRALTRNHGGP